jgi:hypothetical protein
MNFDLMLLLFSFIDSRRVRDRRAASGSSDPLVSSPRHDLGLSDERPLLQDGRRIK